MLTQQEKEYIDLSIASGLGDEEVLRSFLKQSGWSEEKIDSALAYAHQNSHTETLSQNPYLTNQEIPQEESKESGDFKKELEVSLPEEGESIVFPPEDKIEITPEPTHASLVEHFSELEKQEEQSVKINISTSEAPQQFIKTSEEVKEILSTPQEKSVLQDISPRIYEEEQSHFVVAHDENGEQHSIFHLVMIFLLIFFVLVVCVVGLLFWLDIGPFSSITYTKIK